LLSVIDKKTSVADIQRLTGTCSKAALSSWLVPLRKEGAIESTDCPTDERKKLFSLTTLGAARRDELAARLEAI
jgi:DNA-binding MarR family transcriptional regulator